MTIQQFTPDQPADAAQLNAIITFLHQHLDRFGDPPEHIQGAIRYALDPARGGFVLVAQEAGTIRGAVVVNDTRMGGYIPQIGRAHV